MTQIQTAPQTRPTRRRTAGHLVGRVLEPPFMRQLNARLIRQQPWLWSMRIHHAVYLAVLLNIVGLGLAFIAPIHTPYALNGYVITCFWLLAILQAAVMLFWRYGQERFHVVREFGRSYDRTGWREFIGYAAAFFMLMSSLPIFFFTVQQRIRAIPPQTLATELLLVNLHERFTNRADNADNNHNPQLILPMLSEEIASRTPSQLAWLIEESWLDDGLTKYLRNNSSQITLGEYQQLIEDSTPIDELLTRYTEYSVSEIRASRDMAMDRYVSDVANYDRLSYQAVNSAEKLFSLSAPAENNWLRNAWLITFAFAIHFTLIRLIFKYNDRRSLLIVAAAIFGSFFLFWFSIAIFAAIGYFIFDDEDVIAALLCLGFIGLTAMIFLRTRQVPRLEQFKRWDAIQLVILPILLIGVPYAVWGLLELFLPYNYYWYDSSLYLLGGWVFYTSQFIYVPLIPYLKKRFVRLESLPRG